MKSEVGIQEAITILINDVTCSNIPKMTKPALKIGKKNSKNFLRLKINFSKPFNDSQSTVEKKKSHQTLNFLSDGKCEQPGFSKATEETINTYKLGLSNTDIQEKLFLFMSCT